MNDSKLRPPVEYGTADRELNPASQAAIVYQFTKFADIQRSGLHHGGGADYARVNLQRLSQQLFGRHVVPEIVNVPTRSRQKQPDRPPAEAVKIVLDIADDNRAFALGFGCPVGNAAQQGVLGDFGGHEVLCQRHGLVFPQATQLNNGRVKDVGYHLQRFGASGEDLVDEGCRTATVGTDHGRQQLIPPNLRFHRDAPLCMRDSEKWCRVAFSPLASRNKVQ